MLTPPMVMPYFSAGESQNREKRCLGLQCGGAQYVFATPLAFPAHYVNVPLDEFSFVFVNFENACFIGISVAAAGLAACGPSQGFFLKDQVR